MYLARKHQLTTLYLRLLMETGPPFYSVIRVAGRSSRLRGKDLRFLVIFKTVNIGPARKSNCSIPLFIQAR